MVTFNQAYWYINNCPLRKLDTEVKQMNLIFLNEVGLDPGIDHFFSHLLVSNLINQKMDNLSVSYNTSKWLSTNLLSGNSTQLSYGSTATYSVDVNSSNLDEGIYMGYVVNSTNAINSTDIFPVMLNIQESLLIGDITQDGVIDVLDIVLLINIIMGEYTPSSLDFLLSDLNEDGTINVQDCILLINIILTN